MAAAGRKLGLSQAAVAKRVRSLEAEIGVDLVVRLGRTVSPTPAGQNIASRAKVLLKALEQLSVVENDAEFAGRLRLGAIPNSIAGILPGPLVQCQETYPKIQIDIVPGQSHELLASIESGSLDCAILVKPTFELSKEFDWLTLRKEELVLIAPKTLGGRSANELIQTEPFIRYDRNVWGSKIITDYLRKHGLEPRERFNLVTLHAIAVLVDRGLGVALVPDWSPPWPEGLSLIKYDLNEPDIYREIIFLWSRKSEKMGLIGAVGDKFKV